MLITRTPIGSAGGDLGGSYPNPTVTQARGLRETGGPTTLTMGAAADGLFLKRSGSTLVGDDSAFAKPLCTGRLTLTSGTPVTTADVLTATTLYWSPYGGNQVTLYDAATSVWVVRTFSELSGSLSGIVSGNNYDVFAYWTGSAVALEMSAAWNSATARFASGPYATALPTQNGVEVKSANGTTIDASRRYLGTIRASANGQCEDSAAKRLVWNHYHRRRRKLRKSDLADSWSYTSTYRPAHNDAANRVEVVTGTPDAFLYLTCHGFAENTVAGINVFASIDEDGTATPDEDITIFPETSGAGILTCCHAFMEKYVPLGYHYYQWIEQSSAGGTTTWLGDGGLDSSGRATSGLIGWIEG